MATGPATMPPIIECRRPRWFVAIRGNHGTHRRSVRPMRCRSLAVGDRWIWCAWRDSSPDYPVRSQVDLIVEYVEAVRFLRVSVLGQMVQRGVAHDAADGDDRRVRWKLYFAHERLKLELPAHRCVQVFVVADSFDSIAEKYILHARRASTLVSSRFEARVDNLSGSCRFTRTI